MGDRRLAALDFRGVEDTPRKKAEARVQYLATHDEMRENRSLVIGDCCSRDRCGEKPSSPVRRPVSISTASRSSTTRSGTSYPGELLLQGRGTAEAIICDSRVVGRSAVTSSSCC